MVTRNTSQRYQNTPKHVFLQSELDRPGPNFRNVCAWKSKFLWQWTQHKDFRSLKFCNSSKAAIWWCRNTEIKCFRLRFCLYQLIIWMTSKIWHGPKQKHHIISNIISLHRPPQVFQWLSVPLHSNSRESEIENMLGPFACCLCSNLPKMWKKVYTKKKKKIKSIYLDFLVLLILLLFVCFYKQPSINSKAISMQLYLVKIGFSFMANTNNLIL